MIMMSLLFFLLLVIMMVIMFMVINIMAGRTPKSTTTSLCRPLLWRSMTAQWKRCLHRLWLGGWGYHTYAINVTQMKTVEGHNQKDSRLEISGWTGLQNVWTSDISGKVINFNFTGFQDMLDMLGINGMIGFCFTFGPTFLP